MANSVDTDQTAGAVCIACICLHVYSVWNFYVQIYPSFFRIGVKCMQVAAIYFKHIVLRRFCSFGISKPILIDLKVQYHSRWCWEAWEVCKLHNYSWIRSIKPSLLFSLSFLLGQIFSTWHIKIFFLTFPRKQDLRFHANCLCWRQFVPLETICMKYQVLFSWKKEDITKTYLYNFDPFKPHFYIVKLGFTGVYTIFLISAQKHRLWVLVRTALTRRF